MKNLILYSLPLVVLLTTSSIYAQWSDRIKELQRKYLSETHSVSYENISHSQSDNELQPKKFIEKVEKIIDKFDNSDESPIILPKRTLDPEVLSLFQRDKQPDKIQSFLNEVQNEKIQRTKNLPEEKSVADSIISMINREKYARENKKSKIFTENTTSQWDGENFKNRLQTILEKIDQLTVNKEEKLIPIDIEDALDLPIHKLIIEDENLYFVDVPEEHWAALSVQKLFSLGIFKGFPVSRKFAGEESMTRYQSAVMISNLLARMESLERSIFDQIRFEMTNEFQLLMADHDQQLQEIESVLKTVQTRLVSVEKRVSAVEVIIPETHKNSKMLTDLNREVRRLQSQSDTRLTLLLALLAGVAVKVY